MDMTQVKVYERLDKQLLRLSQKVNVLIEEVYELNKTIDEMKKNYHEDK
tara:strand:- start:243 stop:389 length:147 start_codon:yes stop_codon:yes gene_type:complete